MSRRYWMLMLGLTVLTAGSPLARAGDTHANETRPRQIAQGREVNLAHYLVSGKTTVFDFYSRHCPDCEAIAPQVEKLHAARDDLAVVMVDIDRPGAKRIDWQSPVARQYHLQEIPCFKVYGPDGRLEAEGDKAYALVTGWFK